MGDGWWDGGEEEGRRVGKRVLIYPPLPPPSFQRPARERFHRRRVMMEEPIRQQSPFLSSSSAPLPLLSDFINADTNPTLHDLFRITRPRTSVILDQHPIAGRQSAISPSCARCVLDGN